MKFSKFSDVDVPVVAFSVVDFVVVDVLIVVELVG